MYSACEIFLGLVKMTFGLVHANHSLAKGQVVKLSFFVPCDQVDIGLIIDKLGKYQNGN